MIKNILTTLFLTALLTTAFSQFKVNPKIGINLSNFTQHDEVFESTAKFGFGAGIDFRIGGRLYFAPGLYYLSSSTKIKKIENVTFNEIIKFNTFEIPLTVGFNIINKDDLKVSIKAGIEGAYYSSTKDLSAINKDDLEKLNWGFQFGAGLDVKRFTFDLKYDLGKKPTLKKDLKDNINPQYNRMHFYVGYLF